MNLPKNDTDNSEIKAVLAFTLETLRSQAQYMHRQQGWIVALAETIAADPDLESRLKQHPFYDQGYDSSLPKIAVTLENIDLQIRKMKG
jgi:hypothetical protein